VSAAVVVLLVVLQLRSLSRLRSGYQDQVEAQASMLNTIVDQIPASLSILDRNMRYQLVNKAFECWRGLPRDAVIGRTIREVMGDEEFERSKSWFERAIPKARDAGRHFDLRVLAIDGEPAFVVMRTSPHPITNLHLGGRRGDADALRARVPPAAWEAAMASCCAVQQASGAFHVGVDLMFEPGLRAHRVIEGNAFGDLLPNLTRDGLDVYGWQIRRLLEAPRAG
jgi:PAS domain S-box-containing protein